MVFTASVARAATLTVTTVNDVVNGSDGCSLREAITAVNNAADFSDCVHTGPAYGNSDTVDFNIAGSGVHTIALSSSLPDIARTVVIDGYSQPGASANTLAIGDNAKILIRIDGGTASPIMRLCSPAGCGFAPPNTSDGSIIKGLAIVQSGPGGAMITVASNNVLVSGNFIGLDTDGATALATNSGLIITSIASGTTIGGVSPAARNLITAANSGFGGILSDGAGTIVQGNYFSLDAAGTAATGPQTRGITVESGSGTVIGGTTPGAGNVFGRWSDAAIVIASACLTCTIASATVQGNLIGTTADGTGKLGGGLRGIVVGTASNVEIGGTVAGAGNVVSNAAADGIAVTNTNVNVTIQGNNIGTDVTGTVAMGNGNCGINVIFGSAGGTIGDPAGSAVGANVIAFSGSNGIGISTGGGASGWNIAANSIHDNANLGITLGGRCDDLSSNPLPNDTGDGDAGANNLQNYPVLDSPSLGAGTVSLSGSLNSTPASTFRVEFFANYICAAKGNGQGRIFLGSTTVTTDATGNKTFGPLDFALPSVNLVFTATATDADGNNSELSACAGLPRLLDIDDNGSYDALTDGLILIRYLFGLRGPSLVFNAIGAGANRNTSAEIESYIASVLQGFDIDGNGQTDALTDGLIALRYLFGLRGPSLVVGAVGAGASRATATAIENYLTTITP
jgi:CSLREA domain-containing protein